MRTVTALPLRRSREARLLAGIAAGVAHHLGVSPLVVRTLLVLLCGFSGLGLLLYIALWAVLPREPSVGGPGQPRRWRAPAAYGMAFRLRLLGGGVLIAGGLIGGGPVAAMFLCGIGALAGAVVWRNRSRFRAEREARLRERRRAVDLVLVHDQSLQILTLIQHNAGDAQAVRRLAAGWSVASASRDAPGPVQCGGELDSAVRQAAT
jgi:phage shock protein PspC (stress-responsive transcriptional regulator)